jgi:hypothetical protein
MVNTARLSGKRRTRKSCIWLQAKRIQIGHVKFRYDYQVLTGSSLTLRKRERRMSITRIFTP